jgi:hypothetical protein
MLKQTLDERIDHSVAPSSVIDHDHAMRFLINDSYVVGGAWDRAEMKNVSGITDNYTSFFDKMPYLCRLFSQLQ